MDTYVDFMCPVCNQFEQAYGEAIQGLVDDGTITLNIHPISILDRASQGTEYSTRAANAMYCVAAADGTGGGAVHAGDVRRTSRRRDRRVSPMTRSSRSPSRPASTGIDVVRRTTATTPSS